jgi:thiamine biosynthesis protein ThiS
VALPHERDARAYIELGLAPRCRSLRESIEMKLTINGQEQDFSSATLANLIEQLGMKPERVAVELNRNIVPRDQWAITNLAEGDQLEIVHFVGGGSFS